MIPAEELTADARMTADQSCGKFLQRDLVCLFSYWAPDGSAAASRADSDGIDIKIQVLLLADPRPSA
jgi:hypothetical protein